MSFPVFQVAGMLVCRELCDWLRVVLPRESGRIARTDLSLGRAPRDRPGEEVSPAGWTVRLPAESPTLLDRSAWSSDGGGLLRTSA